MIQGEPKVDKESFNMTLDSTECIHCRGIGVVSIERFLSQYNCMPTFESCCWFIYFSFGYLSCKSVWFVTVWVCGLIRSTRCLCIYLTDGNDDIEIIVKI